MSEVEDIFKNKPHFNVLAMCVSTKFDDVHFDTETCGYRWIGTVISGTSLFGLECPKCGRQNSFASFIPDDYLAEFRE